MPGQTVPRPRRSSSERGLRKQVTWKVGVLTQEGRRSGKAEFAVLALACIKKTQG